MILSYHCIIRAWVYSAICIIYSTINKVICMTDNKSIERVSECRVNPFIMSIYPETSNSYAIELIACSMYRCNVLDNNSGRYLIQYLPLDFPFNPRTQLMECNTPFIRPLLKTGLISNPSRVRGSARPATKQGVNYQSDAPLINQLASLLPPEAYSDVWCGFNFQSSTTKPDCQ